MIKAMHRTPKWIRLASGAGFIAISATTLGSTSALATAPAGKTFEQLAEGQQQNPPPPQQQQDQRNKDKQGGQQHNPQNENQQGGQQQNQPNWNQQGGQPPKNLQGGGQQNQQNWNQQGGWQQNQQGGQQHYQQGQRYDWKAYQPGHRPPEWQRYHENFDPHPYQGNWYAESHYHAEPYREPHGWYYRRWVYGETLPPAFWGREYWMDNYWQYGLIDPPYGYVWVRYGPDAFLLDVALGQILSAMYGVFYATNVYAPPNNYAPPYNYPPSGGYSQPPMPQPAPGPVWYYCDNPQGYYPYVQSCGSGWRQVPATPPGATYSQPQ
jgi:hypothetical protein